ncbi:MAG TPA: glycoside hydrolase family 3 N-terminal domain-containing protein [Kofleriaceae bacterium]|nr:glycoside hydrolase family 3 N-terminal domain-containing protein [Kofleriaceae bacterium]
MWFPRASALVFLAVVACGGGGGGHTPEPFTPTDATRAYCGERDDDAIEARITTALGELQLFEKIQMMQGTSLQLDDGVWLVKGSERLAIPGLRMLDGPRGVSAFTEKHATAFPVGSMRGATWSADLEARVGAAMARELRSVGGNVLLAPTVNILRHPRWGRGQETYSEDPHHMAEIGLGFVRGVQGEGVLSSVKHFAANSIEDTRFDVDVQLDERALRELYLPHFERLVVEGRAASVMSAYNNVNGSPSDQQTHLLTDILKGEWAYAGFVESDWIFGTHGDAASVKAGLDIEMPWGSHFANLEQAVARGDLSEHDIDRAVRRIVRAQLCYGLDEETIVRDDPTQRETVAHLALAREVARRGMVLLKNQGGALPLDASVQSIVVMGRNADVGNIGDAGSSNVLPTDVVTALEGLTERAGAGGGGRTVTHLAGTTVSGADATTVQNADAVVIVTGLQTTDEGEGLIGAGDRDSLTIAADEAALVTAVAALNDRVIVVLEGGSAFVTAGWDGDADALVHAFYPGSEGGHALADILLGDAAPSGRLPFTMPVAEADLPVWDNISLSVTYDLFHGYRKLARDGKTARYPFGFGLTYTTFAYSELALDRASATGDDVIDVSVTVTNTGSVTATETVQLYVAPPTGGVERAPFQLGAFAQVELAAGASQRITIPLRVTDLRVYTDGAWTLAPGTYTVRAAKHAEDAGITATFTGS